MLRRQSAPMKTAEDPISEYLAALRKNLAQGDATEHTHRAALQRMVEAIAPGVATINEAKRIACGAPDITLRKGKTPLGHIETKDIGTSLDEVGRGRGPHGGQFKRYKAQLTNWILTDYLRFDWFVGGEFRKTAVLATLGPNGKLRAEPGGAVGVEHLLLAAMEPDVATVEKAKELARRMAGITQSLRDAINESHKAGSHEVVAWLSQWLASFRETLIPEMKEEEFADMFAQTLAYGLFAARIQTAKAGAKFSRADALLAVPKSNPFLRKIFSELAGADMPNDFEWAVDDLVHLLKCANIGKILKDFGHETGQNDPIVHFYETFLAAYDPKLREKRGVYYTPEPVVKYIVRSVDSLLKSHFGKPKGLADEKTLVLDPATGTATFLYFVIQQIRESMKGQEGAWPGYVRDHLLNRIFGFELLMAPYAVAHLKLGLELEETGYKFDDDARLGIYLTNTLEEAAKKSERLVAKAISDEANAAVEIKREKPILVVLGNPPYSGHSANRSRDADGNLTFIGGLMEDYKRGVPELAKPAQAKWLQDDYVKFIRFAQWRIKRSKTGIVAYITNHGYLSNPTFRGMRRTLMEDFGELFVLDLHGSSKKRELSPSGEKDENVFDIQQGVAILLAVRTPSQAGLGMVRHSQLWGSREKKYATLGSNDVTSTEWTTLTPAHPEFLFAPQNLERKTEYECGTSLRAVFSPGGDPAPGIVTTQDGFAVAFSRQEIEANVRALLTTSDEAEAREQFDLCSTTQWDYKKAVKHLSETNWVDEIAQILYRPFDVRWTVYDSSVAVHRRDRVMRHMRSGGNIGLTVAKSVEIGAGFQHVICTDKLVQHHTGSAKEVDFLFPLFLKTEGKLEGHGDLFSGDRPNLSREFLTLLARKLGLGQIEPFGLPEGIVAEDVFNYIYSVLHSPGYRLRYLEFLKQDFPRVPLTADKTLFTALAAKGRELVALHLLRSEDAPQLDKLITKFPIAGTDEVTRTRYVPDKQRVEINDDQYFSNVPPEVWEFTIGGYRVCEKWLKDRKGRVLSNDDIQHWQRVVVALNETRRLMAEIDALIPEWPMQ